LIEGHYLTPPTGWNKFLLLTQTHKCATCSMMLHSIAMATRQEHNLSIMAVQAVVKANSQSNRNGQNFDPPWPQNAWISTIQGVYNYAMGMTTQANPCGAVTLWVVWMII